MKKALSIIITIFLLFSAVSCTANDTADTTTDASVSSAGTTHFDASLEIVQVTPTDITFQVINNTANVCTYGLDYDLYVRNDNGVWKPVELIPASYVRVIPDLGISINPKSTSTETEDWSEVYGELPKGDYKFQKSILHQFNSNDISDFSGNFDEYYVEAIFTIS